MDRLDHRDLSRESVVRLLIGALWGTLMMAKTLDPDADIVLGPTPS